MAETDVSRVFTPVTGETLILWTANSVQDQHMDDKRTEACGRCSMSSVVAMTADDEKGGRASRDPFDGARIEVPESELRKANFPQVWLGRAKRRLDEVATRLTYGR
jgi:hypothetical protein